MIGISIYDMDRTITRRGSWTPWLRFWLHREAPWRVLLLPLLLPAVTAYALKALDRGGLKAMVHLVVMGNRVPRARVMAAAAAFAEQTLANDVFAAAIARIEADRAKGERLVLATASNAYYVDAIAARLGFDDVIATPSRWAGDVLCSQLGGTNCYGAEKERRISAWLTANALDGVPLRFYSDHVSDLPAFDLALASGGEAVAVNPSPALRAVAEARAWPILDWGMPQTTLFERA